MIDRLTKPNIALTLYLLLSIAMLGIKGNIAITAFEDYVFFIHMSPFWVIMPFVSIFAIGARVRGVWLIYLLFSIVQVLNFQFFEFTRLEIYEGLSDFEIFAFNPLYLVLYVGIAYLLMHVEHRTRHPQYFKELSMILLGEDIHQETRSIFDAVLREHDHDYNNLLTRLIGRAELMKMFIESGATEKVTDQCNLLIQAVMSNKRSQKVVDKKIEKIIRAADDYNMDIDVSGDASILFTGDEALLIDVLTNIIKNAHEAGADKMYFTVRKKEIWIRDSGHPICDSILLGKKKSTRSDSRGLGLSSIRTKLKTLGASMQLQPNIQVKMKLDFRRA